ncbi:nitrile hydratase [Methylobacterium sp. Leaf361]|uniref:SH3-like domain-containing protein n=1 Tax=unclassified Methylobacterium TaxID=2615210 RepID=UPI0006F768F9|nr:MULTISPECIES: SH3-like domain-containing protein [unclassified Methylobacterium]KQS67608.1 nitrile hydratase [Methylobacterium sp. Leaf361]SFT29513.1 Nitrile hydratase beta subunit [Methylobacterium sp. yr668]
MTATERDQSIVWALGETPSFKVGERVRIAKRSPVGHYRVPLYLRGREGVIEKIIEPAGIDNEEEAYGRNAGSRLHYYRVAFAMAQLWPSYAASSRDSLHIEVFETWLERMGG